MVGRFLMAFILVVINWDGDKQSECYLLAAPYRVLLHCTYRYYCSLLLCWEWIGKEKGSFGRVEIYLLVGFPGWKGAFYLYLVTNHAQKYGNVPPVQQQNTMFNQSSGLQHGRLVGC